MVLRRPVRAGLIAFALALVPGLALPGCGKTSEAEEETDGETETLAAPAVGTLSIDLSVSEGGDNLDEAGSLRANLIAARLGTYHAQASIVVLIVNINLAAQLAVPVALLRKAATETPRAVDASTWLWSYDVVAGGKTWTGNFTGKRRGVGTATWSMSVTSSSADASGCCTNFELYTGETTGETTGSWQLYDPRQPTPAARLFQVEYDYTSATKKTLTYLVNSDRATSERFGQGSKVGYTVDGDAVRLVVADSAEEGERTIAWNKTTTAGSHTDPQGTKVCWGDADGGHADVACD